MDEFDVGSQQIAFRELLVRAVHELLEGTIERLASPHIMEWNIARLFQNLLGFRWETHEFAVAGVR